MMTKRPGLLLIEQVFSLIILVIITTVVINMFIVTVRFTTDEQARVQVGEVAARALATLDDTLREGRVILPNATIDGTPYTTGSTTLVLALPSIVNGETTNDNDTVVITKNATTNALERKTLVHAGSTRPAGTTLLASDVTDVYFRYTTDDPESSTAVTVVISSTKTANQKPFTRTTLLYETLRNHP